MTEEITFQRRLGGLGISLGIVVFLEALSVLQQLELFRAGRITDWLIVQAVIVCIGVGLGWNFGIQRFMRFNDDGISYIKRFKRCFLKWDEIHTVIDLDSTYSPAMLKSGSATVRVYFTEYKQGRELREFIRNKVLAAGSGRLNGA